MSFFRKPTPLPVYQGGTGGVYFSYGYAIIGNGYSAYLELTPSTSGNVMTSNGTTWTSAPPSGGGSGTVNSGTQYQLGYYDTTGTAISGNLNIKTDANSNLNLAATSATLNSANTFGFKNRIINGGMTIDQRNAGASVTPTNGQYTLDRWLGFVSGSAGRYSVAQSTTVPSGFYNSMLITSTAATTLGTSDYYIMAQKIEQNNLFDLGWGASGASSVTLSFKVYSSVAGTFNGYLYAYTATPQSYPFTYTVSSPNTWTSISVVIPGPTTGGLFSSPTSSSLILGFTLGTGSSYATLSSSAWISSFQTGLTGGSNFLATSGATLYITGVQLEVGTQATSFDFRDYGRELILCQRYYYGYVSGNSKLVGRGGYYSATQVEVAIFFPTTMRTMPSLVATTGTNYYVAYRGGGSNNLNSLTLSYEGSASSVSVYNDSQASGTIGYATQIATQNASSSVAFNSEL